MNAVNALVHADDSDTQQFLTFRLAGEEYGVGILGVQEIRGWSGVTALPHSPAWLLGVINLRGSVVPVIDLRLKFKCGQAEYNEFTVVIILNLRSRVVGIVVDAVSDVVTLSREQIKPPPALGHHTDTSHIIGFGTLDERMRILVDVEKLFAGADLGSIKSLQSASQ